MIERHRPFRRPARYARYVAVRVPALMRLLGDANWWMPRWTSTALRTPNREPLTKATTEAV